MVKDKINGEILLLKLTIPSNESDRSQILNYLDLMNINRSTLFPDLSGSAEYCNYLLSSEAKDDCKKSKKKDKLEKISLKMKDLSVSVFLQAGDFYLKGAQELFKKPLLMYPAAILAHFSIECLLKACCIWVNNEFYRTHELEILTKELHSKGFVFDQSELNALKKINTFFHFRYLMDDSSYIKINDILKDINDTHMGLHVLPGDIGTNDLETVLGIYKTICNLMPKEMSPL